MKKENKYIFDDSNGFPYYANPWAFFNNFTSKFMVGTQYILDSFSISDNFIPRICGEYIFIPLCGIHRKHILHSKFSI